MPTENVLPLGQRTNAEPCPLAIHLFGPFEVEVRGVPLPRLRTRKGQWLLALLALRAGRAVDRPWLAATLWPDSPESLALQSLRVCLADLRRSLGPEASRLRSVAWKGPSRRDVHREAVRPGAPPALSLELTGAFVDAVAFDVSIARGDRDRLRRRLHAGGGGGGLRLRCGSRLHAPSSRLGTAPTGSREPGAGN